MSCSICLDDDREMVLFKPCQHSCVCINCYAKLIVNEINKTCRLCPICRTPIQYAITNDKLQMKIINKIFKENFQYFNFLKNYIQIQNNEFYKVNGENVCSVILDTWKNINFEMKFTVTQCEELLSLISNNENDRIRQIIVCMCRAPWNIDSKLGRSGSCYYGNMGIVPSTGLTGMINRIKNNHESLKKRKLAYDGI